MASESFAGASVFKVREFLGADTQTPGVRAPDETAEAAV
jgi:hypothetical protein